MTIDAARRLKRLLGTELPIILILGFALLPWFWMMLSSIRPDAELTHSPIALWPHQLTLIHHIELLKRTSFAQNLRDSLIVACGAVTLGLTLALPAAYAFSRFRFRGRNWLAHAVPGDQHVPRGHADPATVCADARFWSARHLLRANRWPRHVHTAIRDLAADQLRRRHSAGT
jgi:hypothetical protein